MKCICLIVWKLIIEFYLVIVTCILVSLSTGGYRIVAIMRPCQGRDGSSILLTRLDDNYLIISGLKGLVAEWLRSGLQNRVHRFKSGPGLHEQ